MDETHLLFSKCSNASIKFIQPFLPKPHATYKLARKMLMDKWNVGSITNANNTKNVGSITSNLNHEKRQKTPHQDITKFSRKNKPK